MKKYKKYGYADMSWSPFSGCSAACSYCWARPFAHRLKGMGIPAYQYDDPFAPRFHPERLSEPERWRKPQIVACNFMGDWMDAGHDRRDREKFLSVVTDNPQHIFLTLTKQPQNLRTFFEWWYHMYSDPTLAMPSNLYNGYSPTCQRDLDENMADFLAIPGKKWLSIEPCMGSVELSEWLLRDGRRYPFYDALRAKASSDRLDRLSGTTSKPINMSAIDQVILGGMSGPQATPLYPDWVRKVRDDCAAAGVPFFFKGWGEYSVEETTFCGVPARLSSKVGKKAAGRMLDGRVHNDLAWGETNG